MTTAETSLEAFVGRIVMEAKANRGQTVNGDGSSSDVLAGTEAKWLNNLRAIMPAHVRPSLVGRDGVWRESDHKEAWQSNAKSGTTANAVSTAHDFCDDVVFPNGNVPIRISLVNTAGQNIGMDADGQAHEEKQLEDYIDMLHAKCDGIRQLLFGWDASATYGPRFFHTFYVKDDDTKSGLRAAFESTNVWHEFWDMDGAMNGDLSDGEYFLHRQRKSRRFLKKWAKACNASSVKNHGGKQVNMQALEDAFRYGRSTNAGSVGTNNTSSQSGETETDDLLYQTGTEVWDELWLWLPRKAIDNYVDANPGAIPYTHPETVDVIDDATGAKVGEVAPPAPAQDDADADEDDMVYAMVHLVNDKVVGMLPEPGDLAFRKNYWHRIQGCRDDLGIADRNSSNQALEDGVVKAIENELKKTHTIIAFDASQDLSGKRIEELMARPVAVIPVSKKLGTNSVNDVISATNLPSNADVLINAFQFIRQLSDLDTGAPRAMQQGNPSDQADKTATALMQRLANSGKHMGSKIRALDSDIVWITKRMLEMEVAVGNIELPSDVEIKGGGFRAYSKQLGLYQTIFTLMQYAETNPEIKDRMNLSWVLNELTECQGIDPEKFWISEAEYQQRQQAKQQSPEAQAQMQQLQAAIDAIKATTAKDNALAQKALADAQKALASIEHGQSKLQLDRAKGAMEIADKMRGNVKRNDLGARDSSPSAIVRKPK